MERVIKKGISTAAILFIILFLVLPVYVTGQSGVTFSLSPVYSMPLSSSADIYQYGFGGELEGRVPFPN